MILIDQFLVFLYLWICNNAVKGQSDASDSSKNLTAIQKLRLDLLRYYDNFSKPPSKINVNISLNILHLELNYDHSTLSIHSWLVMEWMDERLTWDPQSYSDLNQIKIADHEIWKPDIITYESADEQVTNNYQFTQFTVNNVGKIHWSPMANFKIFCNLNLENWPFDTQNCSLILGSFSHNAYEMELQSREFKALFQEDGSSSCDWRLKNVEITIKDQFHDRLYVDEIYSTIKYVFIVEATHHMYRSFIHISALALSSLLLSAFWLPLNVTEKFTFVGMTTFTSCLFLIFFLSKVPANTKKSPSIVKFYSYIACLSMLYLIVSIVLYNICNRRYTKTKYIPQSTFGLICRRTISFFFCQSKNRKKKFPISDVIDTTQVMHQLPTTSNKSKYISSDKTIEQKLILKQADMEETVDSVSLDLLHLAMLINFLVFLIYATFITISIITLIY